MGPAKESSPREWLTTGQAAKYCSVTSDTVLKWIRRGRISGVRTAGGHYRVARREIEELMTPHRPVPDPAHPHQTGVPLRCWEYLSGRAGLREECERCTVYRVRAGRCFEVAELGEVVDHRHQFCRTSCQDCVYYRRVMNLPTQVLLVTRDEKLIAGLSTEDGDAVALRVGQSAYEAAMVLQDFRPAFAIVDEGIQGGGADEIVSHLSSDPRVPGLKVVLAVPRGEGERRRHEPLPGSVVSVIEKPFTLRHIVEIVEQFPVETSFELPGTAAPTN
ncbi:MAG: excisionase family DNA-binding protein [Planctomycetota bacterium]